jgi:hypothetical protein
LELVENSMTSIDDTIAHWSSSVKKIAKNAANAALTTMDISHILFSVSIGHPAPGCKRQQVTERATS